MEMTVYRGETEGQNDGGIWYTTDRDHASYFGEVEEYTLRCSDEYVLDLDSESCPELYEATLYPDEEMDFIEEIVDEREFERGGCYYVVILRDWEGEGDCVVDLGGQVE